MRASEFVLLLNGVQSKGEHKYIACCPAHDDHDPSLSVTDHHDRILVKCWAGCDALSVVNSLGLTLGDLFHEKHDYTPPHAFARAEMSEKSAVKTRIEKAKTYLAIATAALKRGEQITEKEIHYCRKAKAFLQSHGAI
jgi:hypothetical protein